MKPIRAIAKKVGVICIDLSGEDPEVVECDCAEDFILLPIPHPLFLTWSCGGAKECEHK